MFAKQHMLIVYVCTCRENHYDQERSTMFNNPNYATANDYQISYNPERSTMLDNPTYATVNDYQISYNPERSTMLDNPTYATVNEYHRLYKPEGSSEMIESPGYYCALKQQQQQVVPIGNPAYQTVLNFNPVCFVSNRLVILLDNSELRVNHRDIILDVHCIFLRTNGTS